MFLIFFECRGAASEVVVYRDNLGAKTAKDRVNALLGSWRLLNVLIASPCKFSFYCWRRVCILLL